MNVRYVGTYWKARKEEIPEGGTMCVFHIKGRKADRIQFGGYSQDSDSGIRMTAIGISKAKLTIGCRSLCSRKGKLIILIES